MVLLSLQVLRSMILLLLQQQLLLGIACIILVQKFLTGATIVKLTRTLAIIPITLVLGFYQAKKASGQNKASIKSAFPMFILYFIIASIITTFLNYFMDRNIFSAEISSAILSFPLL